MSDNFDWNDPEEGFIVVQQVMQTAVYFNTKGDVAIRQRDPVMGDEDNVVIIPLHRVPALIERLQALHKEADEG